MVAVTRKRRTTFANRILRNSDRDPSGPDTVDEVVVANCHFHLEQMDVGSYWIGLTTPDGRYICDINLTAGRGNRTPIRCRVDEDPEWAWDQDKTHS